MSHSHELYACNAHLLLCVNMCHVLYVRSTTNSAVPVNVSGLTSGVTSISASNSHTCALVSGGVLWCWGHNGYGQLGDR